MGIRFEDLKQDDVRRWMDFVAKERLLRVKNDIRHLAQLNDKMENKWTFFFSGPKVWFEMLDSSNITSRLQAFIRDFQDFEHDTEQSPRYRMSTGTVDHMSWDGFPKIDEVLSLRRQAEIEIQRKKDA